jgi:hypothetical protein
VSIKDTAGCALPLTRVYQRLPHNTALMHTQKIAALRDELITRLKESDISPQRELEHAKIVGPAIEVIQTIFDDALQQLSN